MKLTDRIRSRCAVDDECLLWKGATTSNGQPWAGGNVDGVRRNYSPRKLLWLEAGGVEVKHGVFMLPVCGHSRCLTPEHQRYTTRKKADAEWKMNTSPQHRISTTRANRAKPSTKLNLELARRIRARYLETGNAAQVAREFQIHHSHAHRIGRNQSWAEVTHWSI
jgi:hypothetical protein